ncbi:unnamed protein product [Eruca vesicaria subsp. sativa]|uniref:F-box domain-containing protein n=1 Tax=Eruca vesicaria subsp. sativa TaxID=29727 RepID=A0ABC8KF07_ERUVS|nr:unnamed protein product [Eruca vesicaria subsp. sativa]
MRIFEKKLLLSNQPLKKKKRRRQERSKDDDRSQPNHIPIDLTLEILSRLPWKSIMRYQCVSKLWSSFITLPSFINSFTSRSTSRSPTLLVTLSSGLGKYVFSFPQRHIPDGSTCSPFYSYQITNTDCDFPLSESVQGLILLPGLRIWNPTLGWFLALPHPGTHRSNRKGWSSYLGYDPLESKHKVLCVLSKNHSDQPRVITLGARESWRTIPKGRCPSHCLAEGYGRCFNGILYYRARLRGYGHDIIMSFDVKSENFNIIKFPEVRSRKLHMTRYEGSLALVTRDYDGVTLYSLKDAHGHEWTRERFVNHLPSERVWRDSLRFRGTTDAGEFIFAPYVFHDAFFILYFDPRRNSTREVLFEKNMDEFRRSCGLHKTHSFTMEIFLNHIESLFSL